ncbi:MAG: ABC transporter substrate-binding protein [Rhizobiales bacterium PAR1]|nr:MAG: ABC transporter substrate-binding protein [Rhizobiales bacterium PAR1]
MTISRRLFLMTASLAALLPPAAAQEYPARPVTIVVPSAPGGTTDFSARLISDHFSKLLNQSFIVDNAGGASGNIGNAKAAKAAPDGYTLLMAYSGYQVANPHLFKSPGWDPLKSFVPVALVIKAPHVAIANKSLPVTDLKSFVAYAKANPGKVNYASSGLGSIQHIGGEQLKQVAGIEMTHVPYRGAGPALQDVLSGNIDIFITTPPSAVGHVQAKSVIPLALAAKERHPALPDVPTAVEQGLPGFELVAWFALYAPAGTPQPIIDKLAKAAQTAVASKEFIDKAASAGAYAAYLGPKELDAFTKSELDYWGKVIKSANITAE